MECLDNRIIAFLERPDISYCKPNRKQKVPCEKDLNGESVYKPKHYLLWMLNEILNQFDPDESFILTYYTLQKIVSEQKHIIHVGKTAEDDCHCEKCENNELLLTALKKNLVSNQMQNFAEMVKIDSASFMESFICTIKSYDCCRGNCKSCVGLEEYQKLIDYIKTLKDIQYCKWVHEEKKWAKVNIINTGLEFAGVFIEIYEGDYKFHVYNIYCQHSELK